MLLQIIIGAAATAIVSFGVVVARRPARFHIERSITIAASPERAFALVNNFHAWQTWSPWEGPALQRAYEGATEGAGAIYEWAGSGEGRMTIEQSDRPSRIAIKLEYFKPYQATNSATFTFVPDPRGTTVTWAMDGRNNFAARAFFLFKDLDKTVGVAFERGLAAMKTAAERALPREGRA
jgi:uncharacterized protein YndB with AHSA1/START domain